MMPEALVKGAWDIHLHAAPDVVPRAQSVPELARAARNAGLAGLLLKDHTGSTVGRVAVLNELYGGSPRFFSALTLNPPVGGLNPYAVDAALREGADLVFFPTYGARHQIATLGADAFPPAFPRAPGEAGITVFDSAGTLRPEVEAIVGLIARHDAVLATGHLSPAECLSLLACGRRLAVGRMLVTHASEPVPGMTIADQRRAAALGARIEHCVLALTESCAHRLRPEEMRDQIRALGAENVIISSDFGQVPHGPPVAAYARHLEALRAAGLSDDELRRATVQNPSDLLLNRQR